MRIGKYNYFKSPRKNKKLRTVVNGVNVDFGDVRYQHFKDKTGIWSSLDHGDEKRRKNYLTRTSGIKDGKGKLTKDDPMSPNWHSRKILWAA
jgi:hypothetical protein